MTLDMQGKLADLLADEQGREQEAYDLLAEIVSDIDIQMRGVLLDEGRSQIIDQWIAVCVSLISLLIEKGEKLDLPASRTPGEIAFDFHEAAKSRTFIAGLADAPLAMPPGVPGELTEQEARLLVLEGELQALVPQEGGEAARRRLERLRQVQNELQACWEEMARFDPEYVRMRSAMPVTLPELQRLLGDDANANMAFVSFFVDQNVTTIFVVRLNDDQPRVFRSAIGRAELETAVQRIQRTFNGDPDDFPPYPPIRRERPQARSLDFLDRLSATLLNWRKTRLTGQRSRPWPSRWLVFSQAPRDLFWTRGIKTVSLIGAPPFMPHYLWQLV